MSCLTGRIHLRRFLSKAYHFLHQRAELQPKEMKRDSAVRSNSGLLECQPVGKRNSKLPPASFLSFARPSLKCDVSMPQKCAGPEVGSTLAMKTSTSRNSLGSSSVFDPLHFHNTERSTRVAAQRHPVWIGRREPSRTSTTWCFGCTQLSCAFV